MTRFRSNLLDRDADPVCGEFRSRRREAVGKRAAEKIWAHDGHRMPTLCSESKWSPNAAQSGPPSRRDLGPIRWKGRLERETGLEPATLCLGSRLVAAPELAKLGGSTDVRAGRFISGTTPLVTVMLVMIAASRPAQCAALLTNWIPLIPMSWSRLELIPLRGAHDRVVQELDFLWIRLRQFDLTSEGL